MPIYGFGTWQIGGRYDHDPTKDEADIKAIQQAIDLGITHIDTAEIYASGYSEIIVGKAIKGYPREKLLIASKVAPEHLSFDDLIKAAKESLERLDTPYMDLYLIHSYNPDIPLKESIRALDSLVEEGLVKNIGVCNFGAKLLEEGQSYSKYKIVTDQVHYNLEFREPERSGLLKYCQEEDVLLTAWRPVQKGTIEADGGELLKEIAQKYSKTPVQVAINWLILQESVVTICKTGSAEHLKENLGAIGWELSKEDFNLLDREFPNQQGISDTVPLDRAIKTR